MNLWIIVKVLGWLNLLLGLVLGVCWGYSHYEISIQPEDPGALSAAEALKISTASALGLGVIMILIGRGLRQHLLRREAVAIVGISWIQTSLIGALPYLLCSPGLSLSQAIFESVSGFTTTGSSAIADIESFPRAILLWRSLTQWLGGIGILVVFVAILSFLGVGSRSILQRESSLNFSDSAASRIRDITSTLVRIYLAMSLLCFIGLCGLGMSFFDATCHAMTTVATGGFSTRNASIGHFDSLGIDLWVSLFSLLSSVSFMLYVFIANRNWQRLKNEEEARYYLILCFGACLAVSLDFYIAGTDTDLLHALRWSFFNIISIATSTGFSNSSYDAWPLFSRALLLSLLFIGGCAGSTAGGLKMNRLILFTRLILRELVHSYRPHQVFRVHLNGRPTEEAALGKVTFFIALSFLLTGISVLTIAFLEPSLDFERVLGSIFVTLFNGGASILGLDNFSAFKPASLGFLSFLMILGRLEFFAILVLFLPSLWRRY